jgi:tRNA-Thr(GGU) m(6)t(6)A37 methyltransferase TsaA
MTQETPISFRPIGYVRTEAKKIPRHWSVSEEEGVLEIKPEFKGALGDIDVGQKIVVLFHFHESPAFTPDHLSQTPPHRSSPRGVFSICSPIRPNAIGMSVVAVIDRQGDRIRVKNIDMIDGTPILDIKPLVTGNDDCPRKD